jgi:hypothetical protein
MALTEKTFGPITISEDFDIVGGNYIAYYWDSRKMTLNDRGLELHIPRWLVQKEAVKRGKTIIEIDHIFYPEQSNTVELEFHEWENNREEYGPQFDQFLQDLACELLNVDIFEVKEKLKASDAAVKAYFELLQDQKKSNELLYIANRHKEAQIKDLQKQIQQLTNPQIKKVS